MEFASHCRKCLNLPDIDVARLRNLACVKQSNIPTGMTYLKTGQLESPFHARKPGNFFQVDFSAADYLTVTTSLIEKNQNHTSAKRHPP